MIIQTLILSMIVPKSQEFARSLFKSSDVDYFEGLIKPKKFNDTIKNVTGKNLETPEHLKMYIDKKEKFDIIGNTNSEVKKYILSNAKKRSIL